MNVTQLAVIAAALTKAEDRVTELRRRRDEAIVDLLADGLTSADVAAYAGMSQPRTIQIAKRVRAERATPP